MTGTARKSPWADPENEHRKPAADGEVAQLQIAKRRTCLGCGTMFQSAWAGHRRCPQCSKRLDATGGALVERRGW